MSFKHACQRRGSSAPLAAAHVRPHSGLQKCPPHTENSGSPRKRRSGFLPEKGPCCASQVPGDTKGEWREAPSWGLWALVASGETPRCLPSASRPGPGTKAVFTRGDGAEFQTGPAPDPRPPGWASAATGPQPLHSHQRPGDARETGPSDKSSRRLCGRMTRLLPSDQRGSGFCKLRRPRLTCYKRSPDGRPRA